MSIHLSTVRAELVEIPLFLSALRQKEGRPFDKLRANGIGKAL
jgi:hypothetical protein